MQNDEAHFLVVDNTGSGPHGGETLFSGFGRYSGCASDIKDYKDRFNGRRILNLGSGSNGHIRSYLEPLAPDTYLVDLDPTQLTEPSPPNVRGIAQELPFADGTFHTVISTWSFPLLWVETLLGAYNLPDYKRIPSELIRTDLERVAGEISRVLIRGGEVWLSPIDVYTKLPTLDEYAILNRSI